MTRGISIRAHLTLRQDYRSGDSVELVREGIQTLIRVKSHYQNSKFVQNISIKGDLIDIENDIDWHESHVLLKAAFRWRLRAVCYL